MIGSRVETLAEARQNLANCKHPWLLILDNADDPRMDYGNYIPTGRYGAILLTSRNEACSRHATAGHINLEELTLEEAVHLLLQVSKMDSRYEQDARTVAKLLGSHPLALIQAGTYVMNRPGCTFAAYIKIYEKNRPHLLKYNVNQAQSRYHDVYTTFEVSVELLDSLGTEESKDALQLLAIMSMLGQNRLPFSFFEDVWNGAKKWAAEPPDDQTSLTELTQWHKDQIPSLFQVDKEEWDFDRISEAMRVLKESALISLDTVDEITNVSMHPLIHAWAHDRQTQEQRCQSWLAATCIIAMVLEDSEYWVEQNRHLQPHLQAIVAEETSLMFDYVPQVNLGRLLLKHCGWLYLAKDSTSMNLLFNKMFCGLKLSNEIVTRQWVYMYYLYGMFLIDCGKSEKAVEVLEQVVEQEELAQDHPDSLLSQHALASAYRYNGQVKEAVELLKDVVKIREKLAENDPLRLTSQHSLAIAYQQNGQVKEAVELLEHVVKVEEKLVEDRPERLASQHELAIAYRSNGQVKEAVELLEQVVKIKEALAENDPSRLLSQHSLAVAYWVYGSHDKALTLMRHVVKLRKYSLDVTHPFRVTSEGWLKHIEQEIAMNDTLHNEGSLLDQNQ